MTPQSPLKNQPAILEIFSLISEIQLKGDSITENDFLQIAGKIYESTIVKFKGIYDADINKTVEDCETYADFVIDIANQTMVTALRHYAIDNTDAPYELPVHKIEKMKRYYTKILSKEESQLLNLFPDMFFSLYVTSIQKAIQRRAECGKVAVKNN